MTQSFHFYIFAKKNLSICLYRNNCNSVFHLPIKKWMDGNIVGHAYHRILSGSKKEWSGDTIPTWRNLRIFTLKCMQVFSEFKIFFFCSQSHRSHQKITPYFLLSPNISSFCCRRFSCLLLVFLLFCIFVALVKLNTGSSAWNVCLPFLLDKF